jgi:predicted DsbA family dithiol-disulfide isomerase
VRIERIRETFDVEVKFTQFPLHPEIPSEGMTLERLFSGRSFDLEAAQERLTAMMADQGLPYGKRTHTYNSRLAQELAKWAELQPGGGAIHDALFRAYFVEGINLARVDKLVQIAGSVGLPEEESREVLESRSFAASVDGDWHRSSEFSITGVPTFVINGRGVVGAQPYDALEQLVTESGAERRPQDKPQQPLSEDQI